MRVARPLVVAVWLAASVLPACSCGDTDYLHFDSQPTNTQAGAVITPQVVVSIRAPNTNLVDRTSGTVTLTLRNGTTGAALGGTTRADVDDAGFATFSNLSVDLAGPQYILQATCPGVNTAESSAFDVEGGPSDGGPCVNRCRVTLSGAANADFGFGVDGGSGFCYASYGQPGALTADGTFFTITGGDTSAGVIAFSATLNIAGTPSMGDAGCTPSVSGSHPCGVFAELDGGILYSVNGDDGGIGIQISAVSQYLAGTTDGGSHTLWCIDSQITAVATNPSTPSNPLEVRTGVYIQ